MTKKPAIKKPARGRPTKGADKLMQPVTVRFPPAMMAEIEAIQAARADEPEKGQIIRELVAMALENRSPRR